MIYLDNNASTRLDPEVWAAMAGAAEAFGNPSSVHAEGQKARRAVEEARFEVAGAMGGSPAEVFLTSGGTESNAMAIFGATVGRPGRIVISGVEHPSVREPAAQLAAGGRHRARRGGPRSFRRARSRARARGGHAGHRSRVRHGGQQRVRRHLSGRGPWPGRSRRRGSLFHTDAVQAAGRIPLDASSWGVDLLSISAHKLHGPKGAGALYVRRGVPLAAHTPGGGQEKRLRRRDREHAGDRGLRRRGATGRAAAGGRRSRVARLRDRLERGVLERVPATRVVGGGVARLPNTSAIGFSGASGEALLIRLDLEGVAVSSAARARAGRSRPRRRSSRSGFRRRRPEASCVSPCRARPPTTRFPACSTLLPGIVADVRGAASPAGLARGRRPARSDP